MSTPVTAQASVKATLTARMAQRTMTAPASDVRPFRLSSFTPAPFVLYNGFPVLPPIWVSAQTEVSGTGEYLLESRPTAWDIDIPAHTRFIPDASTWDDIAGKWSPAITRGLNYAFTSDAGHHPLLETIEYTLGKEILTSPSLTITANDYLVSAFNSGMDLATDFTIVIAAAVHNPVGYPLLTTPAGQDELTINISEDPELIWGGNTSPVDIKAHATQLMPMYFVLSVSAPSATLWVGTGPSRMYATTLARTTPNAIPMKFQLGLDRSGVAAGQFNLLEFALFDYAMTNAKALNQWGLNEILSAYSSIFGVGQ